MRQLMACGIAAKVTRKPGSPEARKPAEPGEDQKMNPDFRAMQGGKRLGGKRH